MLKWLKQKLTGERSAWQQGKQLPGTKFYLPTGTKLRPREEVILVVPAAIVGGDETIGSVIFCQGKAGIMLNEKVGAWYVKLKPGTTFSLAKSCEVMLVAADDRPRLFDVLPPENAVIAK